MGESKATERLDVVVIGGGLAGLAAGLALRDAERSFVVLEASDALGGRTLTVHDQATGYLDFGAQFLGTAQNFVQHLVRRFMIPTFETYLPRDKSWVYEDPTGGVTLFKGDDPLLLPGGNATLQALAILDSLSLRVRLNVDRLENLPADLAALDQITAEDWIRQTLPQLAVASALDVDTTVDVFRASVRALFSVEPHQLSMLFLLYYAATAGGYANLVDTTGGRASAQGMRFTYGSVDLVEHLLARINEGDTPNTPADRVKLGARVRRVTSAPDGVTVETDDRVFTAQRAIVTMSPVACRAPGGPAFDFRFDHADASDGAVWWSDRQELCKAAVMGRTIKGFATFSNPFWRAKTLMGRALSALRPAAERDPGDLHRAPLDWVIDSSWEPPALPVPLQRPLPRNPYSLMTFMVGDVATYWSRHALIDRQQAVLAHLAVLFGPEVHDTFLGYTDHDFAATSPDLIGGCPTAVLGPGVLTKYGAALRRPIGRVHWAGTETATEWCGYMDGALQSGMRAVNEVLASLPPASSSLRQSPPRSPPGSPPGSPASPPPAGA